MLFVSVTLSVFAATRGLLRRVAIGRTPPHRPEILRAYYLVYLEEELRREALVRDWSAFARFLQIAAAESGQMLNYAKISKDAGVSLPTVKNYYQLIEDMFLGFRVTAFSGSPRRCGVSATRIGACRT